MMTKTQTEARNSVISKMELGEYTLKPNPCPCGAKEDKIISKIDRYKIPIQTLLCLSCGLMRSDPYYTGEALSSFYQNEYRPLYSGKRVATEQFFSEQQTFGLDIYEFIKEKAFSGKLSGKKVFEVGAGAGGILETFKQKRNEVFGADFGEEYLKFGRQKGLQLEFGGAEALEKFGQADIVILNHTLEHMLHPMDELEKIKGLLKDDGVLYIALPGIFYIHYTYRGNLLSYLQNAHVWYFTLKTLTKIISSSGFELLSGNEIIMSVYKKSIDKKEIENENPKLVESYLTKTRRFRFFYELKKFSPRHFAFETLRKIKPLYSLTRAIYRKINGKQA